MPLFVALVLALTALLARPALALAHPQLVEAEPANSSVTPEAPRVLRLRFNETVAPLVVQLIAPDGRAVEGVAVSGHNGTVEVVPPAGASLPSGTYVLSWRVVSGDGHTIDGSVVFSVGAPGARPPVIEATNTGDRAVRIASWLTCLMLYAGLFFGVGGAAFVALLKTSRGAGAPAQEVITLSLAVGFVSVWFGVGLKGIDALGTSLGGLGRPAASRAFVTTAALAALALFAAWASLMAKAAVVAQGLRLGALAVVSASLAATGNASAAELQWLTRPALFVHAAGIAFWIGALPPLAALLARSGEAARAVMLGFSRLILPVVMAIVLTGIAPIAVEVETPNALNGTDYGRVLLLKLVLLAMQFGLAGFNRAVAGRGLGSGGSHSAVARALGRQGGRARHRL